MIQLKVNPEYEKFLPKMTEEQYLALKLSIQTDGLHYPIIHNKEGIILDGHNRNKVCIDLWLEPKTEEKIFENELLEKKFVITSNLQRRHLTTNQKAKMAFALLPIEKELAKKRSESTHVKGKEGAGTVPKNLGDVKGESTNLAAEQTGISGETLRQYNIIQEKGSEELKEKVDKDEISISGAYREILEKEDKEKIQKMKAEHAPDEKIKEAEQLKEITERFKKASDEVVKILASPEVQEQSALFRNWFAHRFIADMLGEIHCPNHPTEVWNDNDWKQLRWNCCTLNIEQSLLKLKERIEKKEEKVIEE